jgi:hypothetical protein
MALILKKKEPYFPKWYGKNKHRLSEERKKRYREDPEYRQRAFEASRRYRRGERTPPMPPDDATISFAQAAEHIGVSISALHGWHANEYFPEPKRHNGRRLWFSQKQLVLLKQLKDKVYKQRRRYGKLERFEEVVAYVFANWD